MRLLAPAVLLVIGGLVSPASESEAGPLPNSCTPQQSPDLQGARALNRDSAASPSNGAKQATGQTIAATSGTPPITVPAGTKVTLALTSPITIASFATRQHALLYVVLILWIAASAPAAKASFSTVNAMETSVWR